MGVVKIPIITKSRYIMCEKLLCISCKAASFVSVDFVTMLTTPPPWQEHWNKTATKIKSKCALKLITMVTPSNWTKNPSVNHSKTTKSCSALPGLPFVTNSLSNFYGNAVWRVFSLDGLGLHLCVLQMMWSRWPHQAETSNRHWDSLQSRVRQPGLEVVPLSMRSWSRVIKRWNAISDFRVSCCLKQRSDR